MSENDTAHRRRIEGALARVHGGPASFVGFEVLQGGISGAYTYRLHLADKDAVLKVVLPGADSQVLARGQREIAFYRDLTPRIPLRVPHVLGLHADAASVALLLAATTAPRLPFAATKSRPSPSSTARQTSFSSSACSSLRGIVASPVGTHVPRSFPRAE